MTEAERDTGNETFPFNPFDPEFRRDPYTTYRGMREAGRTRPTPFGVMLTRHADCVELLHHHGMSNDQRNSRGFQDLLEAGNPRARQMAEQPPASFLFMDPPDHTRLRGLVSKAFTPRMVRSLEPLASAVVEELLAARAREGAMDVVEDLAYPLPVRIICEMLGVPHEDHVVFRGWSRQLARSLDPDFMIPAEEAERRDRAVEEFRTYMQDLVARRRGDLGDDLLSGLIAAEEEGDKLTTDELLGTTILLLIAGHETTVNLIANGVLQLLRHPEQLQRLREDPALARSAVEEVLRYDPPVQLTGRIALEPIRFRSFSLEPREFAVALIGSANRDPEAFEDPDRFDITRESSHHIAFGAGIHFCLGAQLARLEGRIALTAVARRLTGIELAREPLDYKENLVLRGLGALPITFTPSG